MATISDDVRALVWRALSVDRNHVLRQIGEAISQGASGHDVRAFRPELDDYDRPLIESLARALELGDAAVRECLSAHGYPIDLGELDGCCARPRCGRRLPRGPETSMADVFVTTPNELRLVVAEAVSAALASQRARVVRATSEGRRA